MSPNESDDEGDAGTGTPGNAGAGGGAALANSCATIKFTAANQTTNAIVQTINQI